MNGNKIVLLICIVMQPKKDQKRIPFQTDQIQMGNWRDN